MSKQQTQEWWKQTANHVWRTYFAIDTLYATLSSAPHLSASEHNIYSLCNRVVRNLRVPSDLDILRMYYTTPFGQELHNVRQYSESHGIPEHTIWNAVRHANRAVIEEIGLLDRKRNAQDASKRA